MKVIKRGVTPDGVKIQIEDWSENYNFCNKNDTLAGYPIAKKTLDNPSHYPELNRPFRVSFDLGDSEKAEIAFNDLISGKKVLRDFIDYLNENPKVADCM